MLLANALGECPWRNALGEMLLPECIWRNAARPAAAAAGSDAIPKFGRAHRSALLGRAARANQQQACNNGRGLRMQADAVDRQKRCWKNQERESSDSPMLNAFWRVAPSVLFNFLAIFAAAVFFFASDFNSRISVAVQARRFFDFLAINPPFQERQTVSLNGGGRKHNA
jgi:hypothetical protein